ncbi:hypothetical protein [Acinetobacter sp. ANC 3813]|uniref:hypothetical protein n=1 Tax=Acinetobacter sp. ANC 3813 TaxID=1977873 RepID=UPI000A34E58D|nr:hypothetical protein [Acinetobacter sp. ANC 3813]OTG87914.1 hypothetical protein B9T34_16405 [Acinetobacter sp. ANC 3813]
MKAQEFLESYGARTAQVIVQDAPEDADKFFYAYAQQAVFYLKDDGVEWRVLHNGAWRIVAGFMMRSFKDLAINIAELREALAECEKKGLVDLDGKEVRFWREKGRQIAEQEIQNAFSGCPLSQPVDGLDLAVLFKISDAHELVDLHGGMSEVSELLNSPLSFLTASLQSRLKESLIIYEVCAMPLVGADLT